MAVISWSKSECKNGWLHHYQILEQSYEGVMEGCEICKDIQFFKIVDGQIDNLSYLKFHLKQALSREHSLFSREYAEKQHNS